MNQTLIDATSIAIVLLGGSLAICSLLYFLNQHSQQENEHEKKMLDGGYERYLLDGSPFWRKK